MSKDKLPPPPGKSKTDFKLVNIKISIKYQDGKTYLNECEINQMPAILYANLLQSISKTIEDFYKDKT